MVNLDTNTKILLKVGILKNKTLAMNRNSNIRDASQETLLVLLQLCYNYTSSTSSIDTQDLGLMSNLKESMGH